MNCKGPYRGTSSQHWSWFDIVFAQLEVVPITRNELVEIVAAAERYLITTNVKNKESKKQPF